MSYRDMYLYELNYQFMSGFESFLKQKFNNSATTCYKLYQRFTRVIHKAMHKGYIEKYPFENYKIKLPKKKIHHQPLGLILKSIANTTK